MFRYPCPFRPPIYSLGNDGPALEAIYKGYSPATGAPCISNSLHAPWRVSTISRLIWCISRWCSLRCRSENGLLTKFILRALRLDSLSVQCHCHCLALTLLMLGILANDANASFSLNYFAFFANWFYWWSNLHVKSSFHPLLCQQSTHASVRQRNQFPKFHKIARKHAYIL